ncbi:unnamed protein product [Acanthoscelides obtectus]|uniref:Trafficking kinesin-binding protein milt n=2 Tax=Acanthoscelides obtectus TaxID=200917 RepID=A0A9P0P9Y3_ACAOB|nr:unnamed protein product [Acanthoscelides obtectus]CAK1622109.1 Trafficking kinesin-binding protein milt [Acanthoscelides obtectus]
MGIQKAFPLQSICYVLCSNRVSQMTKTYDDIEAVTRLLEEKEKDLELTARIGKELLANNNKLENTVASLETDLKAAHEKITQLSHEVHKKTELIQILTNDMDESGLDSPGGGRVNLELLNKRISSLEDENNALKTEYCRLASCADDIEAQEARLLKDLTGQLTCANSSMGYLEDEIDRLKDENRQQHEQILALQAKLQDTEQKLTKIVNENEEMTGLLQITKENQGSLAVELSEFKARYYEVEALLRDAQDQLRKLRKKQMPAARISMFSSLGQKTAGQFDSLQSELEMSMHSEFSMDSGISNPEPIPQYKKVFETVRCASQNSLSSAESCASLHSGMGGYVTSQVGGPRLSVRQTGGGGDHLRRSSGSIYSGSSLGYPSLDSTGHSDYDSSQTDSEEGYPGLPQKGVPGVPGATELEAALKRLTPGEVLARRANLQHGPTYGGYEADSYLPFGCRTPDSLMSTGSSGYHHGWKLPEKLQIVKPIEGSQTLHQWSQLAQPTFGGILDERPGVKIRVGKELEELGLESYALSDLEEDEEYSNPGKMFDSSVHTYTYTNSTIMHPDDGTFVTQSTRGSRVASVCSSVQPSPPQTPRVLSRRNSCTTFSTTFGLAKVLNERGIKAVTPSCVATPAVFSPTATPCNSPDFTPSISRSGSPEPEEEGELSLRRLLGSVPRFLMGGASTGGGVKKKRQQRDKRETLVTRIERIGIQNLMANPSASMYARPALTSPMAQLTCLLPSHSMENVSLIGQKLEEEASSAASSEAPSKTRQPSPPTSMGVPGTPGSGALNKRLEQLAQRKQRRQQQGGTTRPDLGTVNGPPKVVPTPEKTQQNTALGTLSSLLFGRKGGLF